MLSASTKAGRVGWLHAQEGLQVQNAPPTIAPTLLLLLPLPLPLPLLLSLAGIGG